MLHGGGEDRIRPECRRDPKVCNVSFSSPYTTRTATPKGRGLRREVVPTSSSAVKRTPTHATWSGPSLVAYFPEGAVIWSRALEEPDDVGALGVSIASTLSSCGALARLFQLETVSIQSSDGATVLALREEHVAMACRWRAQDAKTAERAIDHWRSCSREERQVPPSDDHDEPSRPMTHASTGGYTLDKFRVAVLAGLVDGAREHSLQLGTFVRGSPSAECVAELLKAIRHVQSEDVTPGVRELLRLANDQSLDRELRWLAFIWASRAARKRGDFSNTVVLAHRGRELARGLDSHADAVSVCTLAEALVATAQLDPALDHSARARDALMRYGDRATMARALSVDALVAAARHAFDDAKNHATAAREADPSALDAVLLLARILVIEDNPSGAARWLAGTVGAEARWLRGISERLSLGLLQRVIVVPLVELSERPATKETLQAIRQYVEVDEIATEAAELLAIRHLRLGQYSQARQVCEDVLSQPQSSERVRDLESLFSEIGQKAPRSSGIPEVIGRGTGSRGRERSGITDSLFSGDLGEFNIPELLEFLRAGQRSGTLVCQYLDDLGALRLNRGRISHAIAPSDHLSAGAANGTGPLDFDRLETRDVNELEAQALLALSELVAWKQGQFYFEPISSPSVPEPDVTVDPQFILLEVFKRMDEASLEHGIGATNFD